MIVRFLFLFNVVFITQGLILPNCAENAREFYCYTLEKLKKYCFKYFTFEKELAASIGAKDINFAAMPVPTSASNVDFALNCKIDF